MEWGLGHAARCVPVIKELLNEGYSVFIGNSGVFNNFFYSAFSNKIRFIYIPSVEINYKYNNAFLSILIQVPKLLYQIFYEHYYLSRLVKKNDFSLIISDNRYGIRSNKIKSILITHQVYIRLPENLKFLRYAVHYITKKIISGFNECWIPDFEDEINCFSGALSHGSQIPKKCRYVGLLSRFSYNINLKLLPLKSQILIILSGPEPQRTNFENIILEEALKTELDVFILRGKPEEPHPIKKIKNITIANHLDESEFYEKIMQSEFIICRSGYSTIMDLITLGKNALLVPTPGQTEQEYLADFIQKKGRFKIMKQNDFNLLKGIEFLKSEKKTFNPVENSYLKNIMFGMHTANE